MQPNEYLDILLTSLGLISILAGAKISANSYKKKSILNGQWKLFLFLISLLIIGYLFFIAEFIIFPASFNSIILSLIFFFGGIFVFLTMNLFKNSIQKIESAHTLMHSINELRCQAEHDDLTGLYNKKFFKKYLNEVIDLCKMTNKKFGLLYIDVNNFKFFNDNFGHLCGDQVLISIAKYFNLFFRNDDIIARLGGDEFAVLLKINKEYKIEEYANNLINRIKLMNVNFNNQNLKINLSVGIYIITNQIKSADEALALADSACYKAKEKKEYGSQYSFA